MTDYDWWPAAIGTPKPPEKPSILGIIVGVILIVALVNSCT